MKVFDARGNRKTLGINLAELPVTAQAVADIDTIAVSQIIGGVNRTQSMAKSVLVAGAGGSTLAYVAAETQIGTWLTAPLYRSIITLSAGPQSETLTIAHGITGITAVVHWFGYLAKLANNLFFPLPYVNTNGESFGVQIYIDTASLKVASLAGNFNAYTGCVVLEYVK